MVDKWSQVDAVVKEDEFCDRNYIARISIAHCCVKIQCSTIYNSYSSNTPGLLHKHFFVAHERF